MVKVAVGTSLNMSFFSMTGCNIYSLMKAIVPVDLSVSIEEKNIGDNYLSAGEMPLPALYQVQGTHVHVHVHVHFHVHVHVHVHVCVCVRVRVCVRSHVYVHVLHVHVHLDAEYPVLPNRLFLGVHPEEEWNRTGLQVSSI